MNEYRVTKYNPALRNSSGAYTPDEWTSFEDIGQSFGGIVLTRGEYQRVEDAYVAAAVSFLREAAVPQLAKGTPLPFKQGDALTIEQTADVLRGLLRGQFWCRLETAGAFVHVGWDNPCTSVYRSRVRRRGGVPKTSDCTSRISSLPTVAIRLNNPTLHWTGPASSIVVY